MNIRKLDSVLLNYALELRDAKLLNKRDYKVDSRRLTEKTWELKQLTKITRNIIIREFWKLKEDSA